MSFKVVFAIMSLFAVISSPATSSASCYYKYLGGYGGNQYQFYCTDGTFMGSESFAPHESKSVAEFYRECKRSCAAMEKAKREAREQEAREKREELKARIEAEKAAERAAKKEKAARKKSKKSSKDD